MIEDVMARLQECNYPAAPITDRSSTFGWVKWSKLAKKVGLKPVFGVELAVTDSIHAKKPAVDYWTFISHDSLVPINKLVELATQQFRYEPLITYEQACAATDVTKIMGHRSLLQNVKPDEHTFLGLSPSVSRGYVRAALNAGFKLAACSDNKYVRATDKGFYEIVCGRNASIQTYDQHIQTREEWALSVSRSGVGEAELEEAWQASTAILSASTAKLKQATLLKPDRPATLREMCESNAVNLGCDLTDPVYSARLERELTLIAEKEFEDYFYIVHDICKFARKEMIVGPARGSSCGSLVCYLLGITTIDPIPYGLIFERFIDINRNDLPDIDIDFSDQQRHLVFEYMHRKYGQERVARLGTVAMFKPRSALQEAGAALRVPKWKTDSVAESMIERSSGDARAMNTLEDTIMSMPAGQTLMKDHPEMMIAARMEGHPRHSSQHAAGIVVCSEPVSEYISIDDRTGATMCDKHDAEGLNFLKIDALGLTQLSVFEDALELAGLPRDTLEKIPLEDKAAFQVLNDGKFSGIFQFNGIALQSISKQFKIDKLDDIVSITALARPGPLASGGAHEWVRRRNGVNPIIYPHKVFEPYLRDTLGIVLYQEQVMEIARNIGGLSWGDVTALRKAMSKSLGKEYFDQFGDPWKVGAIAKGVDQKDADKVWDDLCAYGSWSFNKSHSVAYGIISYQCCWLKAHYPFEFAAATLSHESDPNRQIMLLREMADEGFEYVPVDKEYSTSKWSVGYRNGKKFLVGPLSNVKGVGPKMVNAIIGARARGERMPDRAAKLLENPETPIDSLYPIKDAFKRLMPDPAERNIYTPPTNIKDIKITDEDQTVLVFCTFTTINPRDENEAVMVARRGYEVKDGLTASLNLQLTDDTDTVFGKIDRWKYPKIGKDILDRGGAGKTLYAVKGRVRGGTSFRMISIDAVRYIGRM
jgi:DNA-directed DNA polymerase III PolC